MEASAKYIGAFVDFDRETAAGKLNQVQVDTEWFVQYLDRGESFGVVSAFLLENSAEANIASHKELQRETLRRKYGYKEIVFRYYVSQKGNLTPCTHRLLLIPKIPLHPLLELAQIFGQKSVAVRGNKGLDFIRVKDEQLLWSIPLANYPFVWSSLLVPFVREDAE